MLSRWSGFLVRRPLAVLLAGLALALAAGVYGAGVFGSLSQGGFDDASSESAQALERERDALGNQGVDVIAIYSSDDLTADEPAFRESVEQALADLPEGTTARIVPWFAEGAPPGLVSQDGHAAQVLISLAGESQDDYLVSYDELEPTLGPRASRPTSPVPSRSSPTSTSAPRRTCSAPRPSRSRSSHCSPSSSSAAWSPRRCRCWSAPSRSSARSPSSA